MGVESTSHSVIESLPVWGLPSDGPIIDCVSPSDRLHNPRVIAGTTVGFEGLQRFRSRVIDPLRNLLPMAVEVEAVPSETRETIVTALEARGFFIHEEEAESARRGHLILAGTLDRFDLLRGLRDVPPDFAELAASIVRAVDARFQDEFEVPTARAPLRLGRRPLVMGILNVTPDSFSDGGRFEKPDVAIAHAFDMVDEGADLIDVGAESTRPGAPPVTADEEVARLEPIVKVLGESLPVPLSVDTRKAEVADRMLGLGAALINDVSGLEHDPRLAEVVARRGGALVLNHIRGTPQTMQESPRYDDAAAEICRSLRERLERAGRAGVPDDRVILDPGIGFGKRLEDNLEVLARLSEFRSLGRPLLVGCSRKSFLGLLTGRAPDERSAATAATTALLAGRGVKMVRVHEVRETVDVLKVLDAIDGRLSMA